MADVHAKLIAQQMRQFKTGHRANTVPEERDRTIEKRFDRHCNRTHQRVHSIKRWFSKATASAWRLNRKHFDACRYVAFPPAINSRPTAGIRKTEQAQARVSIGLGASKPRRRYSSWRRSHHQSPRVNEQSIRQRFALSG